MWGGAGALLIAGASLAAIAQPFRGHAAGDLPGARPTAAEQLRYIGRDWTSGLATTVNDRFIAEVERSYALYGTEESQPVPPSPAAGATVSRLTIPALKVDAAVQRYGVDRFGRLDIPQDASTVGWNPDYTALPGTGGSTFFAAHVVFAGAPGVFNRLSTLVAGDEVGVALSDGSSYRYRVTSVVDYPLDAIDMGALLAGREGVESLTLMTCSGLPSARGYEERTVVLAELVD